MNEKQARTLATVGAFTVTGVGALALNGGPWGAVLTGAAAIITWHQGDVLYHMTRAMVLGEEVELVEKLVSASPSYAVHEDQRPMAKLKRLVGKASTQPPSHPTTQPDTLLIGYDKHGKEVRKSWKELKSILILGLPGQGKSSTASWLIAQIIEQGGRIAIIDRHARSDESLSAMLSPFEAAFLQSPAYQPEKAMATLQFAEDVLQSRMDGVQASHVPFLLVIDEMSDIMKKASQKSPWGDVARSMADVVEGFNAMGRKYNCFCLCIGQISNASRTGGTEIRELFSTRLIHGMQESQARLILSKEIARAVPNLATGECIVDCEGKEDPFQIKVPRLDARETRRIAERLLQSATEELASMPDLYNDDDDTEDADTEETATENEFLSDSQSSLNHSQSFSGEKATFSGEKASLTPIILDKGPRSEDINIDVLIAVWNGGGNSVNKLMKIFKMTNHQAQQARKRILAHASTCIEESID